MNKLYSLLTAAVICSAAHGLIASEEPAKPFLDPKTQDVVKNTAKYYALGYVGFYGAGVVCAPLLNVVFPNTFKAVTVRELIHSIPYTAPTVFGGTLAYHRYQERREYLREINAA